jgi:hypothetical protein
LINWLRVCKGAVTQLGDLALLKKLPGIVGEIGLKKQLYVRDIADQEECCVIGKPNPKISTFNAICARFVPAMPSFYQSSDLQYTTISAFQETKSVVYSALSNESDESEDALFFMYPG